MALREKLEEDIKASMRSHDQARLDALRFFKNAVLAVEKEQKKELDDAGVIEVATKQASDRRDSIKAFEEGGREAAAAKEAAELVVLEEFLPPQMSAEELMELIKTTVSEVGAVSIQDTGKLMGKLMPQVRGKPMGPWLTRWPRSTWSLCPDGFRLVCGLGSWFSLAPGARPTVIIRSRTSLAKTPRTFGMTRPAWTALIR